MHETPDGQDPIEYINSPETRPEKPPLEMGEIVWDVDHISFEYRTGEQLEKLPQLSRAKIKTWNNEKRYGFVTGEDGRDYYIGDRAFLGDSNVEGLRKGDTIYFDPVYVSEAEPEKGRRNASLNQVRTEEAWVTEQAAVTFRNVSKTQGPDTVYVEGAGDLVVPNRKSSFSGGGTLEVKDRSTNQVRYRVKVKNLTLMNGSKNYSVHVPDPEKFPELYEVDPQDPLLYRLKAAKTACLSGDFGNLEREHESIQERQMLLDNIKDPYIQAEAEKLLRQYLADGTIPSQFNDNKIGQIRPDSGPPITFSVRPSQVDLEYDPQSNTYQAKTKLALKVSHGVTIEVPLETTFTARTGHVQVEYPNNKDVAEAINPENQTVRLHHCLMGGKVDREHPIVKNSLSLHRTPVKLAHGFPDNPEAPLIGATINQEISVETDSGVRTLEHPVYRRASEFGQGIDASASVLDTRQFAELQAQVDQDFSQGRRQQIEKIVSVLPIVEVPNSQNTAVNIVSAGIQPDHVRYVLTQEQESQMRFLDMQLDCNLPFKDRQTGKPVQKTVPYLPTQKNYVSRWIDENLSVPSYEHMLGKFGDLNEQDYQRIIGEYPDLEEYLGPNGKDKYDKIIRDYYNLVSQKLLAAFEEADISFEDLKQVQDSLYDRKNRWLLELATALKNGFLVDIRLADDLGEEHSIHTNDNLFKIKGRPYGLESVKRRTIFGADGEDTEIRLDPTSGLQLSESGVVTSAPKLTSPMWHMGGSLLDQGEAVLVDPLGEPLLNSDGTPVKVLWQSREERSSWEGDDERTHRSIDYNTQVKRPEGIPVQIVIGQRTESDDYFEKYGGLASYFNTLQENLTLTENATEAEGVNAKYQYLRRLRLSLSLDQLEKPNPEKKLVKSRLSEMYNLLLDYGEAQIKGSDTTSHPIHALLDTYIAAYEDEAQRMIEYDQKVKEGYQFNVKFDLDELGGARVAAYTPGGQVIDPKVNNRQRVLTYNEIAPTDTQVITERPKSEDSKKLVIKLMGQGLSEAQIDGIIGSLTQPSPSGSGALIGSLLEYGLDREQLKHILHEAGDHLSQHLPTVLVIERFEDNFVPQVAIWTDADEPIIYTPEQVLEPSEYSGQQLLSLAENIHLRLNVSTPLFKTNRKAEHIKKNISLESSAFDLAMAHRALLELAKEKEIELEESFYNQVVEPPKDPLVDDEEEDDDGDSSSRLSLSGRIRIAGRQPSASSSSTVFSREALSPGSRPGGYDRVELSDSDKEKIGAYETFVAVSVDDPALYDVLNTKKQSDSGQWRAAVVAVIGKGTAGWQVLRDLETGKKTQKMTKDDLKQAIETFGDKIIKPAQKAKDERLEAFTDAQSQAELVLENWGFCQLLPSHHEIEALIDEAFDAGDPRRPNLFDLIKAYKAAVKQGNQPKLDTDQVKNFIETKIIEYMLETDV